MGDLEGIRLGLDHLCDLGVDAIRLSPFFVSPMADFGYDVANYCDVDPLFGSLDDFDRLLADCHERGLKVLIDWVPNHTSDQHPWFVASRASHTDPKRDWHIWRDPKPDGGPPNNWIAAFTGESARTFDETTGQYYLHLFLPEQPDLNWHNPDVEAAMHDTPRFWLDRGVDGFRMDVIHLLGKDEELAACPTDDQGRPQGAHDYAYTHELVRRIRRLLDSYPRERVSIGEVYLLSTRRVATYYGDDDELHLAFNFPPLYAPWEADAWRHRIDRVIEELDPREAWPTWVLSNHDNPRHAGSHDRTEIVQRPTLETGLMKGEIRYNRPARVGPVAAVQLEAMAADADRRKMCAQFDGGPNRRRHSGSVSLVINTIGIDRDVAGQHAHRQHRADVRGRHLFLHGGQAADISGDVAYFLVRQIHEIDRRYRCDPTIFFDTVPNNANPVLGRIVRRYPQGVPVNVMFDARRRVD